MKKVAIGICALAVAAAIGTGAVISSASTAEKNSVGSEKALEIALNDAGVSKEKAKDKSSVFTKEKGKYVFDVDFEFENKEYDYKIGAKDGSIVDREIEIEDGTTEPGSTVPTTVNSTSSAVLTSEPQPNGSSATTVSPTTSNSQTVPTQPEPTTSKNTASKSVRISATEAKRIALSDSGVSESDASFKKVKLEKEHGIYEYELEFTAGSKEFEYTLNAFTGEIIGRDIESEHDHPEKTTAASSQKTTTGFISASDAKAIVLSHAGLGESEVTFKKFKLDEDDGIYKYEVEFKKGFIEYEYEINARDGSIIDFEKEIDD
ncbi:MAG: PepSY domain-containing protein [Clostridia bacterium]|nr:PepSY domain-containing protein [Clostridia bacterium]